MKLQLNPVFETFCLLGYPNLGDTAKKEIVKKLDALGVNGAAVYAANFPLVERYYDAFASRAVQTEGSALFEDMSTELGLLLIINLLLHPQWLDDFDAVSDEEATAAISEGITDLLESDEGPIEALEASELSDQAKWQMTALLQQPRKKLALVIDAINANLATYEHAYARLASEIEPLLEQLEDQLEKDELSSNMSRIVALNPQAPVIPSLANPLVILVLGDYNFVGLLLNRMMGGRNEGLTETEAALVAKALSDPSKVKILGELKQGKLYSLEIAQKLELTPATTSHHMNMLLSAGLVEVSKEGAKAYYSVCRDTVERYRAWLHDRFL